jgi:uncharacterized protein YqgQ
LQKKGLNLAIPSTPQQFLYHFGIVGFQGLIKTFKYLYEMQKVNMRELFPSNLIAKLFTVDDLQALVQPTAPKVN